MITGIASYLNTTSTHGANGDEGSHRQRSVEEVHRNVAFRPDRPRWRLDSACSTFITENRIDVGNSREVNEIPANGQELRLHDYRSIPIGHYRVPLPIVINRLILNRVDLIL